MFFDMIEAGVFPRESRGYLSAGSLYEAMAKTVAHAVTGMAINTALMRRLPPGWSVCTENPIAVDRINAPLPDFMIVRGEALDYARDRRHPGPEAVGLIIEVAVTSLSKVLGRNLELYARAGVPAYWVLDVIGRKALAHSGLQTIDGCPQYTQVQTVTPGEAIPLILDGQEFDRIPFAVLCPWESRPI
jgi:Uma2 family endonuclease